MSDTTTDPIDELYGIGLGFADQQHAMTRIVQGLRAAGSGADPAALARAVDEFRAMKKATDGLIHTLAAMVPENACPGGDRAALTAGVYA